MRILLILNQDPQSAGYGGNHRSYQILHDLRSIDNHKIILILGKDIQKFKNLSKNGRYSVDNLVTEFADRLNLFASLIRNGGNRFRLLGDTIAFYSSSNFNYSLDEEVYKKIISGNSPFDLCIIDHAKYLKIAEINRTIGLRTILITQNLEAFDNHALVEYRNEHRESFLLSINQELMTLNHCQRILAISQAETWFLNSLELPAVNYPYLPVGDIRDALLTVRNQRETKLIEPGLFLLVGTYVHKTAGKSMRWFLDNAKNNGLPVGAKVKVIGKGTEELVDNYKNVPGVEILGWVEKEELDYWMASAQGLLVPQFTGFGAVTRISEGACAGIPVLVSEHAVQSIDAPPGVISLPNDWESWFDAIEELIFSGISVVPELVAYEMWEKSQPNPLLKLLSR